MNIFVGNLSFAASESDVKSLFEAFGAVASVRIKKKSGKNSRGFGFVNMPDDIQAEAAMTALQDKEFMGRPLKVSAERPKPVKPKKDYKEIKPKTFKKFEEDKPRKKFREDAKRVSQPAGAQAWEKRKGRGTAKPWKKKPGGVNKKFKYAR